MIRRHEREMLKLWQKGPLGQRLLGARGRQRGQGQAPKWWKPQEKAKQTKEKSINNDFMFTSTETCAAAISTSDWLADSAATTHIARNQLHFTDYISKLNEIEGIAPGSPLKTIGRGTIKIDFLVKNKNKIFTVQLKDVKHAPMAPNNLISIGQLMDHNYRANFTRGRVEFQTPQGQTFAEGRKNGWLYQMHTQIPNTNKLAEFAMAARTWDKWHRTLGHISIGAIQTLKNNNLVEGMDIDKSKESTQCMACIQGRQTVEPFPKQAEDDVTQIGELTVSDIWGPANMEGPSREQYFYSFTDAKTCRTQIYFSHTKTEVLCYFKEYKALIENQTNNKLKFFHSDGSGKYINEPFKTFCAEASIIMEQTVPYSPAQNSITEQINQTLLEHARAMIFSKNISKTLWPEAIAYTCYIKNRSPTRALGSNTMPYKVFYNKKPNIARLQEFGIQCWIMVPEQRRTKFDPKAEQHIFTGIADNTKAWRYYNTRSKIIQTSRNIIFNKQDTNVYPIPGEEEEEIGMNLPVIPAATMTEVDDVDDINQVPMPNTEAAAPSTGTPEPGPWRSN